MGVAKGTLYYHFSSKEEIFYFLVEEGMKLLKNSIEIKKSTFISYLFPVSSVDKANFYLEEIRKKHYKATHNCYAYIIGKNMEIKMKIDTDFQYQMRYNTSVTTQNIKMLRYERI